MAKKYTVRFASPLDWDVEEPEFKGEMLYINKYKDKIGMDMQTLCKSPMTAYKRFYKAVAEAQKNGEFAEGYDLLADTLIAPEEVDWDNNSPIVCSPSDWKDCGYVMNMECLDDNLWYLWLNVKYERMVA